MSEHPFVTLLGLAFLCASALGGLWLTRRAPRSELDLSAMLKSERLAMQADFAEALEKAVGISEQVKKHRARIDGSAGGRPPAPTAPTLEQLTGDQVARLPIPEQLAWAARRARRG